jgi:hypothetical protein
MQWGRSRYVSTFPWKDFLTGWIRKIQKIKKERMEERKRRVISSSFFNFFLRMWRFPYWCVLSGTPSGYCPCATLLRRTHSYGNLPYNIIHINVVPSA